MNEQDPEVGPTYHYDKPKPFEFAIGDEGTIQSVDQHIEKWIGKPDTVYHEIISDKVHIDVHIVNPSERFLCYTLVTSGMSDLPMRAPPSHADLAYAELFLCLPPDWKMGQEQWKQHQNYWPIQALKYLARFPHQYETWLSYGHTIPNGNPPAPFDPSTQLSSLILLRPFRIPSDFHELKVNDAKTVRFFSVVPLHNDELEFKLKSGAEAIERALLEAGGSEIVDPKRKSAIERSGFFGRLFGR